MERGNTINHDRHAGIVGGDWPVMCLANGATGTVTSHYTPNGNHATVMSLSAPAAGTSQVLTLNTTAANWNTSSNTYHIFVVGTPI